MKQILLFFIIINPFFLQAQNYDTIHWSPCYQLKFEDFQGNPDRAKIDLANSYIKIDYKYNVVDKKLQFEVFCYFFKNLSWTKYNMPTLIEHEQVHFDIAKLFALKLESRFRTYQLSENVGNDLKLIYDSIIRERSLTDKLLDTKIKGAVNDTPQKLFMKDIRKQLPSCKKR